jgi:hypothetical protein
MFNVYKNQQSQQTGSRNLMGSKTLPTIFFNFYTPAPRRRRGVYCYTSVCTSVLPSIQDIFVAFFSVTVDGRNLIFGHKSHIGIPYTKCMFNVYKNQQSQQTGSRNLMGSKTLPTIWHTYMKLVTKYRGGIIREH